MIKFPFHHSRQSHSLDKSKRFLLRMTLNAKHEH